MAKRNGRIRQTLTTFQKVFEGYEGFIKPFSWTDRLPELLHISMALVESDFKTVEKDFFKIADKINESFDLNEKFHFNLSHSIKLIKEDNSVLKIITHTCFEEPFQQFITFYGGHFELKLKVESELNIKMFSKGYAQILDGRSEHSILSKYIMFSYYMRKSQDPFNLLGNRLKVDVLKDSSKIMELFPPTVGKSDNIDINWCERVWMCNHLFAPFIPEPDTSIMEEQLFNETKMNEFRDRFLTIFSQFKKINLIVLYSQYVAEINMGFVARICNLGLDVVNLVETHRCEIAELINRSTLESFIVFSWLMKNENIEEYKRFRDFEAGREILFGEKLLKMTDDSDIKEVALGIKEKAIKDSGENPAMIATERGDAFTIGVDKMAKEVWGEESAYYFLYKRLSDVTHGHWRVISKYHLSKSLNPAQNGLYQYNENKNRFAGMDPAFMALIIGVDSMLLVMDDIEKGELEDLKEELNVLNKELWSAHRAFIKKNIYPKSK